MDTDKNVTALFVSGATVFDEVMSRNVVIYPNPTEFYINIEVNDKFNIKRINVLNIDGKELLEQTSGKVSLQNFKSGVYFIKIETNKGTAIKRIIKE